MEPTTLDTTGLIDGLRLVFQDAHAAWYLGVATFLYLIIQVLRGKAGFKVPKVTDWFNNLKSKVTKVYIILFLFCASGALNSLKNPEWDFWTIMDGILAGLSVGVGTIGVRQAIKATMESESLANLKDKMSGSANKDLKGELTASVTEKAKDTDEI